MESVAQLAVCCHEPSLPQCHRVNYDAAYGALSADLIPNRQPRIDHSDDFDAGGASPRQPEMLPAEALD